MLQPPDAAAAANLRENDSRSGIAFAQAVGCQIRVAARSARSAFAAPTRANLLRWQASHFEWTRCRSVWVRPTARALVLVRNASGSRRRQPQCHRASQSRHSVLLQSRPCAAGSPPASEAMDRCLRPCGSYVSSGAAPWTAPCPSRRLACLHPAPGANSPTSMTDHEP